jgi:ribosomal protein S18 acetylase RimI-like enzyme
MTEPAAHPDGLQVRRVDETDWRAYRDARLAALLDTPAAFGSTYAAEAAFDDERWLDRVRGPARTWLAVRGALPVGTVTTVRFDEQAPDETCLVGMWVAGHARGSGVGEVLIETALTEARGRGLRRVVLDVAEENLPARRLYERLGFRPTGRTGSLEHDRTVAEIELACDL